MGYMGWDEWDRCEEIMGDIIGRIHKGGNGKGNGIENTVDDLYRLCKNMFDARKVAGWWDDENEKERNLGNMCHCKRLDSLVACIHNRHVPTIA